MSVQLEPCSADDLPNLVRVHTAAFKSDKFSQFMLQGREENTHERLMETSINTWLQTPSSKLMKAINGNGEILGWACWLVKEPQPRTGGTRQGQQKRDLSAAQSLGRQMGTDAREREQTHMPFERYHVLQALATDPSEQRRGIGSQLVLWGAEASDAENLPCWAHASEASHHIYSKAGFEEVGSSTYNIDEFVGSDAGWGEYTFRYMMRPASP